MESKIGVETCTDPSAITHILQSALPREAIDEGRVAKQILLDPNFCAEGSLIAYEKGDAAGYCWAVNRRFRLENAPDDSDQGYLVLFGVSPAFELEAVGTALLNRAEEHLRGNRCASCWVSPYAPGYFTPGVDERACSGTLHFLTERGYEVKSRPLAMSLELADLRVPDYVEPRRVSLERSLAFHVYEPRLTIPLLRFATDEFAGDWVRFARDAARAILRGEDPGRLQIACLDGRVVGFSHYENGRFGPIGVSKDLEGKGVGSVLMLRTLRAMRSAGQDRAWFLWTDDRTAGRFYAPWGWKEWRRFSILRKML